MNPESLEYLNHESKVAGIHNQCVILTSTESVCYGRTSSEGL